MTAAEASDDDKKKEARRPDSGNESTQHIRCTGWTSIAIIVVSVVYCIVDAKYFVGTVQRSFIVTFLHAKYFVGTILRS